MERMQTNWHLPRLLVLAVAMAFVAACERAPDGSLRIADRNGPEQAITPETAHPLFVDRRGEQLSVRLPECGDFSKRTGYNFRNTAHSNWSCAQQRNLGLMVANPPDIAGAVAFERRDPTRTEKVIRDYRAGKPTRSDNELGQTSYTGVIK